MEEFGALDKTLHPFISPEELMECENIVKADSKVQELAKAVGSYLALGETSFLLAEHFK